VRLHHKTEARGVPSRKSPKKKKKKRWAPASEDPAQAMQRLFISERERRHPRDHAKTPKKKGPDYEGRIWHRSCRVARAREKFGSSLKGAKWKKETTSGSTTNREKRLHPHIDGAMKADH